MNLLCRVTGHDPGPDPVRNAGPCFAHCRRCGVRLVQEGAKWRPLPEGLPAAGKVPEAKAPPLSSGDPRPLAPDPTARAEAAHILIVDDDPLIVDLLSLKLSSHGYRVTVASDGGEALARLERELPDAVLLDAMMPSMDGYEVLRRIRESEAQKHIIVIMVTARRPTDEVVQGLGRGPDDYILKPFQPAEVVCRLARLLTRRS